MPKGDYLGEFELFVMLALAQLGVDAYGIGIRQEIERRTGRDVAIGAVYATLDRLEQKSLVRFTVAKAQPGQSGRPRKCFTATAAGERALAHTAEMLARMMRGWRPQPHPPGHR
jgi:DNA-binding PadR family transcriptional regulator